MLEPSIERIEKHLKTLVGERNPNTSMSELQATGLYLCEQFRSFNLEVSEETVPFFEMESSNILGRQSGEAAAAEIFILAAHYDTVAGSPGADDNASAVAALLEIARCLEPCRLHAPLVFAGFTLEEYGFVGSSHFIRQLVSRGERVRGMISLEMVGYRDRRPNSQSYPPYIDATRYPDSGDFIAVVGNEPSTALTLDIAQTMTQTVPSLPVEHLIVPGDGQDFDEVRLSDHAPFWDHGIPAVMITDTAFFRNPNYHQASDTLATLDTEFIRDVAKGVAGFLERHLV